MTGYSVFLLLGRFFLCLWMLVPGGVRAESVRQVPGVIHIDAIGEDPDGLSVSQATGMVERAHLGVAVITPHEQSRVEYGLPPLRRILKFGVSRESIRTFGAQRYVESIQATDDNTPDVVTIDGTEAIPAYYWEGSAWRGSLTVRNMHKHILVIGLPAPEDYMRLPSMVAGFPEQIDIRCLAGLWPVLIMLPGVIMMIRARRIGFRQSMRPGMIVAGIGLVFLVDRFPFCPSYDAYHGDPGEGPYQAVIDYANARGAMTFWAHPEGMERIAQRPPWPASALVDSVMFVTKPYPSSLLRTSGYTGFAIFEEGISAVGRPGGIWDQTLIEYCAGVRSNPVWAIGEVDFERRGVGDDISTCQTVFLLEERTRSGVLAALREGRVYARRAPGLGLSVRDFRVSDAAGRRSAGMGGRVSLSGAPRIRIELGFDDVSPKRVTILVIRSGTLIRTIPMTGAEAVTFEDQTVGGTGTIFYRFLVQLDGWPVLASNPIFTTLQTP